MNDELRDFVLERIVAVLKLKYFARDELHAQAAEDIFNELIASKETRRYGPKADDTWESRYVTRWRPRQ